MTTPIRLACPKCAGDMLTYERAGVHVDQCRECRGVFLDRGELDRLIDLEAQATVPARPEPAGPREPGAPYAERRPVAGREHPAGGPWSPDREAGLPWDREAGGAWSNREAGLPWDRGRGRPWDRDDDDDDDRPWSRDARRPDGRDGDPRSQPGSRRRSFLGELFEGFGD